jgi:hypothetical protein
MASEIPLSADELPEVDIDALKAALVVADFRLTEIRNEWQVLSERLTDAQAERDGLALAIRRHGIAAINRVDPVLGMNRSDAVQHVLNNSVHAMTPGEVHQRLVERGRDDAYNDVTAALAYLKRKHRAYTESRGKWRVGDPHHETPDMSDELF